MVDPLSVPPADQTGASAPEIIPLSSTQGLLWKMAQAATSDAEFNISIAIDCHGTLDAQVLQLAFYEVVARHRVLRSTFVQRNGDLYRNLGSWPERQSVFVISQVASVDELSRASGRASDISSEPAIRAFHLSLHSQRHIVLLVLHRVACDIWSAKPLAKELLRSYLACLHQTKRHALLPIATSGLHQRNHLATPQALSRKAVGVRLNSFIHRQIVHFACAADFSVAAILHAAVAVACVGILNPGAAIVIEHPYRTSRLSRHLIGQHSRFLVGRPPERNSETFREVVARSQRMLDAADPEMGDRDLPARNLLCPTTLIVIHHNQDDLALRFRDCRFALKSPAAAPGPFDLCLDLTVQSNPAGQPAGVDGIVLYRLQTIKRSSVEQLIASFAAVAKAGPEFPDAPLNSLKATQISGQKLAAERTRFVQPTNPTHHMIQEIWQDLLKLNRIGVQDVFEDLGGTEPLLGEMLSRVALASGEQIVPSAFAEPVTIDLITKTLVKRSAAQLCRSIGGKYASRQKPLFLLHGDIDGGGYYAHRMVSSLDPARPVYLLNPHGIDGSFLPASVNEMASSYLEVMLDLQKGEPFHIVGYCNAGLVAFEIARQLQVRHGIVGRVGMISTLAANESGAATEVMPANKPLTHSKRYFMASSAYRPGWFDGEVTLFLSKRHRNVEDQCGHWKQFAKSVRVQPTSGNHANCLTRWVDQLGMQLRVWLEESL